MTTSYTFELTVEVPDDYHRPTAAIITEALYESLGDVDSQIVFDVEEVRLA